PRRAQVIRDHCLVNRIGIELSLFRLNRDTLNGVAQVRPAAVVDREAQGHAGVLRTEADVLVDLAQHLGAQSLAAADGREADILLHELRALTDQVFVQEGHEEIELGLRPLPVLDAQAIERELPQTQPAPLFDHRPYALDPARMSLDPREPALLCPPPTP